MIEKNIILLNSLDSVRKFVSIAMERDYDVDLCSGKYIVNGKSIMGVFSLDLTKPIKMIAHCESDDDFFEKIEQFIVKGEE
ncbi:MAG: HPr family phosphocarrier protein [Oscillospiraceae bacterium]|nr:HPr family phosphocarrier protein [Oscillospiraceae bacterium]